MVENRQTVTDMPRAGHLGPKVFPIFFLTLKRTANLLVGFGFYTRVTGQATEESKKTMPCEDDHKFCFVSRSGGIFSLFFQ